MAQPSEELCALCGGVGLVREFVGPEAWRTRVVTCTCRAAEVAHARWERALRASDISPRLLAVDFGQYDPAHDAEAFDAAQAWTRDAARASRPWLFLYGGPGSGKTHLLAAAFNSLMAQGRYPLYTLVPNLLDYLRRGLDDALSREEKASYAARLDAVRDAPILILDDLGAEKRTEWSDETLFKLLDHRYREELPTAVASNLIPADLELRIASRLQDRMLSAALLMTGPDHRLSR